MMPGIEIPAFASGYLMRTWSVEEQSLGGWIALSRKSPTAGFKMATSGIQLRAVNGKGLQKK